MTILVSIVALGALSACGGGLDGSAGIDSPLLTAILDKDASIAADDAALSLTGTGGNYLLKADGLNGTKAIYGQVAYDPELTHFAGSERPAGVPEDRLMLVFDQPDAGLVHFGMVLANFDERAGLSGTAPICELSFASGAAEVPRRVSTAPNGPNNHITNLGGLLTAEDLAQLTWRERLAGDGDNNGEVNGSDLTPIGQQFLATPDPFAAEDSQARDADYNSDGEVGVGDITVIGQQFLFTLGGYAIMTGNDIASLVELTRFDRSAMFPTAPATSDGELTWTWTDTTPLTADTRFWVWPYDRGGTLGDYPSDTGVLLEAPVVTFTVDEILGINVPGSLPLDGQGNNVVLLTELAVDGLWSLDPEEKFAEDFATEVLELTADVTILEDEDVHQDSTHLLWYISEGGGLAFVGNNEGSDPRDEKGLLTFINRGKITVTAQVPGDFNKTASVSFVLLSIQDLALSANTTSPSAGDTVQFTATGTFDWDGLDNGNELTQDLTSWCNWNTISTPADAPYSINTVAGTMSTTGAAGAEVIVRCEFPRTENVTLYDNVRRLSNAVTVDVS